MLDRLNIQNEVIDGYSVSAARKKLWITELDLLELLEQLCKREKINYFLLFGSAIGAVRHKGFIPWDDDIDLGMLREDFEKFINADKSEWPEYVDIQYGISEHGADYLLRIRDARTTGIVRGEQHMPGNKGAFIEVYVFDYVNDNRRRKMQIAITGMLKNFMSCFFLCPAERHFGQSIKAYITRLIGIRNMWNLYNWFCKLQNKTLTKYVDTPSLPDYAKTRQHLFYKEDVIKSIYVPFEDTKVRIPKGYDRCLSTRYGEYMKLPPLEKRGTHHSYEVFYDPDYSYKVYEESEIIDQYFKGNIKYEKL